MTDLNMQHFYLAALRWVMAHYTQFVAIQIPEICPIVVCVIMRPQPGGTFIFAPILQCE